MSVLVGKKAPDFTAPAVMPDNKINDKFNLTTYIQGKVGILFFWPADFSFVCPSEIIAFNNKLKELEELGAVVVGCSVDSKYVHLAWKSTPLEKGGIGDVQFPLVADVGGKIAESYDVLTNGYVALRGTFLIDQAGKVVHQVVNDLPLGRNIEEVLRMTNALLFTQKNGEVCPANWNKGKDGMKADVESVADYLAKYAHTL